MGHGSASEFQFGVHAAPCQRISRRPGSLHELARRHSLSRNLIRLWIRKYEAGEFTDELAGAVHVAEVERKIAELERKVDQLTMEVDLLIQVADN